MRSFGTATFVLAFVTIGQTVSATDKIWDLEYAYGYGDTVTALASNAFVICSDCGADRLSKVPAQYVAIKYNPPNNAPALVALSDSQDNPFELVDSGSNKEATANENGLGCILGTVLFKFDSSKITRGERAKLDEIAAKVLAGASLSITGYTCTIGLKSYNQKLSEQRARAVADYFKGKGITVKDVGGKGECCQTSPINRLNRRVEIEDAGRNH